MTKAEMEKHIAYLHDRITFIANWLESAQAKQLLPEINDTLGEVRRYARVHKGMMESHWKAIEIYKGHTEQTNYELRLLRRQLMSAIKRLNRRTTTLRKS
jgi:hypothetical protein